MARTDTRGRSADVARIAGGSRVGPGADLGLFAGAEDFEVDLEDVVDLGGDEADRGPGAGRVDAGEPAAARRKPAARERDGATSQFARSDGRVDGQLRAHLGPGGAGEGGEGTQN